MTRDTWEREREKGREREREREREMKFTQACLHRFSFTFYPFLLILFLTDGHLYLVSK